MWVRDVGVGPVVLLLHGTLSPADGWAPVVEVLRSTHRILIPDLPGYGQSAPASEATMEVVTDALAAMLAKKRVTRLRAVIGHSSGAYRALDLALRHVGVDLMVSLAGVVTFDEPGRAARRALARRLIDEPGLLEGDEISEMLRALMLSPAWAQSHPDDLKRVLSWQRSTTATALATELFALAGMRDLRPELPGLGCPVYARVGEGDVACPVTWSEDIVRCVPRSELDIVPGCGHALLMEDTAATVSAIAVRILDHAR